MPSFFLILLVVVVCGYFFMTIPVKKFKEFALDVSVCEGINVTTETITLSIADAALLANTLNDAVHSDIGINSNTSGGTPHK